LYDHHNHHHHHRRHRYHWSRGKGAGGGGSFSLSENLLPKMGLEIFWAKLKFGALTLSAVGNL